MYGLNQDDTNLDPITGKPIEVAGQVGALQPSSAPPDSGGMTADVSGAPLSRNQATDAQAGGADSSGVGVEQVSGGGRNLTEDGGTTQNMVQDGFHKKPDETMDIVQQTFDTLQRVREGGDKVALAQMEQMNESIEAQGGGGEKAKDQMIEQAEEGITRAEKDGIITKKDAKKKRFALKNIFNVIKPEEMNMFLIDFGMRAMMAGETMGSMGALGAAGSGAMGALEGRRQTKIDAGIEDKKYALEHGLAERGVAAQEVTAGASMKRAEAAIANQGYSGKDVFLRDFYRKQGRSDEWIAQQLAGAKSYEQSFDIISEGVEAAYEDAAKNAPVGGTKIGAVMVEIGGEQRMLHTLKPNERAQLAEEIARERMKARTRGAALSNALIQSQEE